MQGEKERSAHSEKGDFDIERIGSHDDLMMSEVPVSVRVDDIESRIAATPAVEPPVSPKAALPSAKASQPAEHAEESKGRLRKVKESSRVRCELDASSDESASFDAESRSPCSLGGILATRTTQNVTRHVLPPVIEAKVFGEIEPATARSREDASHPADEEGIIRNAQEEHVDLLSFEVDGAMSSCRELSSMDAEQKVRMKRGITMDTGAHDNVIPKRMIGRRKIQPSEGSQRGMNYVGAGGEKIPNEGQVDFPFESVEGHKVNMVFQIAEVNKPLGSVAYFVDRQFRVVYDQDEKTGEDRSCMIHKPTKKVYKFRRQGNVWILDAIVGLADIFGDFSGPE